MKKQLSVFLFGALLLGAAGTFTSCKDYDDDIANLQGQINENAAAIKALQDKVNEGKWITGISAIEGGFTVTFSDGQSFTIVNGKDGAQGPQGEPGAGGAAGTEWTISEDGYWVCNGEKTDVKAVGKDGKDGEDAKPEVLYENGQWKLWNGTEYVAVDFGGSAPAQNMPYYYVDPNDQNYAILVVYDKDGKNPTELRLPLNEGLAQLVILDELDLTVGYLDMQVRYAPRKESTKWETGPGKGTKELPAVGQNIVTTNRTGMLVQVTPANYDLGALKLKFVNGKGEDVPVTLGAAQRVDDLATRAVSKTGVYSISVTPNPVTEDDGFYSEAKPMSLYANESVRSTYSSTFTLEKATLGLNGRKPYKEKAKDAQGNDIDIVCPAGYPYYVQHSITDRVDLASYIYDSYIEVKAGQANQALALQGGIKVDGMKIESTSAAKGKIIFTVHYVDVVGYVGTQDIAITFGQMQPEESILLASDPHTMQFNDKGKGTWYVPMDEYFADITGDDRILWNATHSVNTDVEDLYFTYVDKNGTERSGTVANAVTIKGADKDKKDLPNTSDQTNLAKLTGLNITLDYTKLANVNAYDSEGNPIYDSEGNPKLVDLVLDLTADEAATLTYYTSNGDGIAGVRISDNNNKQNIYISFKVNAPSADAQEAQYHFDDIAWNGSAFLIYDVTADLSKLITPAIPKNNVTIDVMKATKAKAGEGNYNVDGGIVSATKDGTYPVDGVTFSYAGHIFAIPVFNITFKTSGEPVYTFELSNPISVARGGKPVKVKLGAFDPKVDMDYAAGLIIKDAAGNDMKVTNVTAVTLDAAAADYVTATSEETFITVAPTDAQIAKKTTFKAKITFDGGETQSNDFVTVQ